MDRRIFSRFHLDAGIGDVLMHPLETARCRDWLGFAGIEANDVAMIPREQQVAEKIHAYTVPRPTPNSRVKDLVDLALLIGSGGFVQRRTQYLAAPEGPLSPPPFSGAVVRLCGQNICGAKLLLVFSTHC